MRAGLTAALEGMAPGYAEVRVRRRWSTTIVFRRQRPEVGAEADIIGGVARCLMPGHGWGAVAFSGVDRARMAVRRARELSLELRPTPPIELAPIPIRQVEAAEPLSDDPRTVPLDEKRRFLEQLTADLLGVDRRVVDSRTTYADAVYETWLATNAGTWLHECRAEATLGALAVASEGGTTERALDSVALRGGFAAIRLRGDMMPDVARRAVQRLGAVPIRPGRYTVVLDPRASGAVMLQGVVEQCRAAPRGHEREGLTLGNRVGPECLTVGDDPSAPGLRPSLVLDDEGTPVGNVTLVQNGVVVGQLHTRETAHRYHAAPTGHALAPALRAVPAARPTNAYLAKGRPDASTLLADAGHGLYLADVIVLGVEGGRLTLVPGAARMIRRGELAEAVKCPAITGDALALLGRLEAVAGDFAWDASASRLHEGQLQGRSVTTGAPHTRFVDLDIGAMFT
jgi:TldD protein